MEEIESTPSPLDLNGRIWLDSLFLVVSNISWYTAKNKRKHGRTRVSENSHSHIFYALMLQDICRGYHLQRTKIFGNLVEKMMSPRSNLWPNHQHTYHFHVEIFTEIFLKSKMKFSFQSFGRWVKIKKFCQSERKKLISSQKRQIQQITGGVFVALCSTGTLSRFITAVFV